MDSSLAFVNDSTLSQAYEQFVLYRNAVKAAMIEPSTPVDATAEPLPPIPDTRWCPACTTRLAGVASDCCMKTKRFKSKGSGAEPDNELREVWFVTLISLVACMCIFFINCI